MYRVLSPCLTVLSAGPADGAERGPATGGGRGHQETYNPGFSLSASNASLAAVPTGPGAPAAAHARSRSVQNLHKPGGAAPGPAPGPAPPPRPTSVHSHYQQAQMTGQTAQPAQVSG